MTAAGYPLKLRLCNSPLRSCLGTEYFLLESQDHLEGWCKHTGQLLLRALIPKERLSFLRHKIFFLYSTVIPCSIISFFSPISNLFPTFPCKREKLLYKRVTMINYDFPVHSPSPSPEDAMPRALPCPGTSGLRHVLVVSLSCTG